MDQSEGKKKTAESENKKMFRSRFEIFVLNALNEKDGAGYGYDVINYIQSRTKGHYKIKTFSTIYNTLKRLEEQNYVVSGKGDGETNGATRVYYSLTPEGREYLQECKEEYKYTRTLLDNLLTDEDFDLENEEPPYVASNLKPLTRRNRSDSPTDGDGMVSDVEYSESNSVGAEEKVEQNANTTAVPLPIEPIIIENSSLQTNDSSLSSRPVDADEAEAAATLAEMRADSQVLPYSSNVPVYNNKRGIESTDNMVISTTPKKKKTVKKLDPGLDYKTVIERITAPVMENNSQTKKQSTVKQKSFAVSSGPERKQEMNVQPVIDVGSAPKNVSLQKNPEPVPVINDSDAHIDSTNVDKFRVGIRSEGYVFSSYRPKKHTDVKFVYGNKLLRDSVVLSVLYFIICILLLFLLRKTFAFSLTALLVCGGLALSVALVFALIWFRNPEKKKKDNINLKIINLACVGLFTVFFMLDLIVVLLMPNGKGLSSPSTYSPVIAASVLVFFGIIFSVLYKTDNYSVK